MGAVRGLVVLTGSSVFCKLPSLQGRLEEGTVARGRKAPASGMHEADAIQIDQRVLGWSLRYCWTEDYSFSNKILEFMIYCTLNYTILNR